VTGETLLGKVNGFLAFSTIFYEFSNPGRKRKREIMNSDGLKLAQVSP
jgi:hypothetical protein